MHPTTLYQRRRNWMKRLLPLCVVVLTLNGWSQTLETNVRVARSRLDLGGKVDVVAVHSHVYLYSQGSEDVVREWIETHSAEVRRQSPAFSRWYHNSPESYRVVSRPSLHLTWVSNEGVWDVHLDKWCPRFAQPGALLGHLALEIGWHALTGHTTSQARIWQLLNRCVKPTLTGPRTPPCVPLSNALLSP